MRLDMKCSYMKLETDLITDLLAQSGHGNGNRLTADIFQFIA